MSEVIKTKKNASSFVVKEEGPSVFFLDPTTTGVSLRAWEYLKRKQIPTTENPLEIDAILENIFGNLDVEDLKNSRLVKQQWLRTSLPIWRNKAVLRVSVGTPPMKSAMDYVLFNNHLTQNFGPDDSVVLGDFLFEPFRGYHFYERELDSNGRQPMEPRLKLNKEDFYARWINTMGHSSIRYLGINNFAEEYTQLVNWFLAKLPNLEHLELRCGVFKNNARENNLLKNVALLKLKVLDIRETSTGHTMMPIQELFTAMPNLERLRFGQRDYTGRDIYFPSLVIDVLDGLLNAKNSMPPGCLEITDLDMMGVSTRPFVSIPLEWLYHLEALSLPLTRLSVDIGIKTIGPNVQRLLTPYRKTLKYLRVNFGTPAAMAQILKLNLTTFKFFVNMEQLEEVRFISGIAWAFRFLRGLKTPKLRKLVMEDMRVLGEYQNEMERNAVAYVRQMDTNFLAVRENPKEFRKYVLAVQIESLKTFEFQPNQELLEPKAIGLLSLAMPNLTELSIALASETFTSMCFAWRKLEKLTILEPECEHHRITDQALACFKVRGWSVTPNIQPNLSDMMELTDLTINCRKSIAEGDAKLTDLSVHWGFNKVNKLNSLSVGFKKLSKYALERLQEHVKVFHIQDNPKTPMYDRLIEWDDDNGIDVDEDFDI